MYNKSSKLFSGEFLQKVEYTVYPGIYKIECWGAQGSGISGNVYLDGKGGYVSGFIKFDTRRKLYIFLGGIGKQSNPVAAFNGGGLSQFGGGGATDVRLIDGEWDNFESLMSRIIVAGAGAGGDGGVLGDDCGGSAGGTTGYSSQSNYGQGGTQTSGGHGDVPGSFGQGGGNGNIGDGTGIYPDGNGAGGSGYFGGGGSTNGIYYGGGGGSSFISGYKGCNAINSSSTKEHIIMTNQPIHSSGLRFFNMSMIDGNTDMTSPTGSREHGHSGYGAVRITHYGQSQSSNFQFLIIFFSYVLQQVILNQLNVK